jgi:hypothetical protein
LIIANAQIAEVVQRLTNAPPGRDSLDTIELIMELEEEYGSETVRWAVRFLEAAKAGQSGQSDYRRL